MRRKRRQITGPLLVGCLLASGLAGATPAQVSSWPLSQEMLHHAQLDLLWQQTLAVKADEQLETMTMLEDRLYIRSKQNHVWSIDRSNGELVFNRSIASAGFPILGWVVHDDTIITVIDNQIVELNKQTGARQRVIDLELSIIAPPVRNSQFYYVSAADRRVHVFRASDLVRLFRVAADSDSLFTSIHATEDRVVLGTEAGNVIGLLPDAPKKLWQFDAAGAMAGPVVVDGDSFFFAGKDTQVYRVDALGRTSARMAWRYQTESILDRPPRVTATTVYQYATSRGLAAIDKRSGRERWVLPEGVELLAESGGRAYVATRLNTLTVMDNAVGKLLYSVNLASVTRYAANTVDGHIYVADDRGQVACLRPAP